MDMSSLAEMRAQLKAAQQDANYFKAVLGKLAVPVITVRDRRITDANAAAAATFGYDKTEIVGQDVSIIMNGHFESRLVDASEAIGASRAVECKHKDGSAVPVTLSVSAKPDGAVTAVLYRRSETEAQLKAAEQRLAQSEADLLKMQLECLRLQLVQAGVPGMPNVASGYESPPPVLRPGVLKAAWAKEYHPNTLPTPGSQGICIAAFFDRNMLTGRIFKDGMLGRDLTIKPGSHAFVKTNNREPFLRMSMMSCEFGAACGHPQLACEEPVLFAGEVEVDASGQLLRWNSMSGTYKCNHAMAFQAGLPLDKFWAVATSIDDAYALRCEQICISSNLLLFKVLPTSELDFKAARQRWNTCIERLLVNDAVASYHYQTFQHALSEFSLAVLQNWLQNCGGIT